MLYILTCDRVQRLQYIITLLNKFNSLNVSIFHAEAENDAAGRFSLADLSFKNGMIGVPIREHAEIGIEISVPFTYVKI